MPRKPVVPPLNLLGAECLPHSWLPCPGTCSFILFRFPHLLFLASFWLWQAAPPLPLDSLNFLPHPSQERRGRGGSCAAKIRAHVRKSTTNCTPHPGGPALSLGMPGDQGEPLWQELTWLSHCLGEGDGEGTHRYFVLLISQSCFLLTEPREENAERNKNQ